MAPWKICIVNIQQMLQTASPWNVWTPSWNTFERWGYTIQSSNCSFSKCLKLERPPPDEDSEWCFREVYTSKANGEPRRTVNYQPLNKWVKRDAFATESPFHIARRIPGHSWKTVSDAWNGYHSVPLHENSRHLTTWRVNFATQESLRVLVLLVTLTTEDMPQ